MKKLYTEPAIEVIRFNVQDVLKASGVTNSGGSGETPLPEVTTPEFDWDW